MSHIQKQERIFFIDTPAIEELCGITVKVPPLLNSADSPYQAHVIRCRELIFTESDIVASPLLNTDEHILIIMLQKYYKTGKLQSRFQKIGIEMQKPRRVLPHELQDCINYTIQAKMAPLWNKMGEYLIEGRDFAASNVKTRAVIFNLSVTQTEAYISLKGYNVRCSPVKLQDLDISPPLIHEFLSQYPEAVIEEYHINRQWCHILPSMKKGQIVGVHHTLPADSPFKSYKDMRRYWKNTYGYRLPESENGILFFQVYFKLIGQKLFTYPHLCIRQSTPTILLCGDDRVVISSFLADLQTKVFSLCGKKLRVVSGDQTLQPQLCGVGMLDADTTRPHPNLKTDAGSMVKPQSNLSQSNTFSIPQEATLVDGQIITVPASMTILHVKQQVSSGDRIPSSKSFHMTQQTQPRLPHPRAQVPSQKPPHSGGTGKIVPIFKRTQKSSVQVVQPNTMRKTIAGPTFKPNVPKFMPKAFLMNTTNGQNSVFLSTSRAENTNERLNSAVPQKPRLPFGQNPRPTFSQSTPMKPWDMNQNTNNAMNQTINNSLNSMVSGGCNLGLSCTPIKSLASSQQKAMTHPVLAATDVRDRVATPEQWDVTPTTLSTHNTSHSKRQTNVEGGPVMKKQRAKPKVHEDIDIIMLARANQLSKVNTVTLINWLKVKGVHCKSKDKKSDLIERVKTLL